LCTIYDLNKYADLIYGCYVSDIDKHSWALFK